MLRAALLATGDRDAARDATQEAFKRAFMRWRRLGREPWAGGWVMTTALNLCRRRARDARREEELLVRTFERPAAAVADGTAADTIAALRRLPFRQRQATILYYWGDLPVATVAELMGAAEGTVRALLAQARSSLRTMLEVSDV